MNPADSVVMAMLCSKRLLGAFNDTDAAVPDAVVAVPAIVESRERAAPSAAETAAVLAGFKLGAETKIESDVRAKQLASGTVQQCSSQN